MPRKKPRQNPNRLHEFGGMWCKGNVTTRCALCGVKVPESQRVYERRPTGFRFKNQKWCYCTTCKPQPAKRVEIGRRIG